MRSQCGHTLLHQTTLGGVLTRCPGIHKHLAVLSDKGVLYACCDLYGMARPLQPFVCTVQLARKTWNLHPTKLPDVCEYLGIELEHHQALSDAEACARIVIAANQPQRVCQSKS
ncbi:Exonuclease [uncultured Leptolyngbya sp.]|uniref:Exonuclease n=1 Tax=uncultured Leptolyngbya sp. TaxID=332963 RepID=A0A6J4L0V3_9CYAN|nr:Exonuclease [uncultured Leptolyngbya sp.]